MSWKSKQRYIDLRTGLVKTNILSKDAVELPSRHRNMKSFKASFGGVNHFEYDFKSYFIVVDVKYAFEHFQKNTYSDNRQYLNATLLPTLRDPLMVICSHYKGEDTLTFYKPFKSSNGLEHIVMFKLYKKRNNKYYFKTIYKQESLIKIKKIIETTDKNTIYFKYD
jgi:hypothetical protein